MPFAHCRICRHWRMRSKGGCSIVFIKELSRENLIDVLQVEHGKPILGATRVETLPFHKLRGEMLGVWENDPSEQSNVPDLIVVRRTDCREFLAWAATYLKTWSPFTAFCRVLDADVVKRISGAQRSRWHHLFEAFVGAILGEGLSYIEDESKLRQLSPAACSNTYSFAMARGLVLGTVEADSADLFVEWERIRRMTKQPLSKIPLGEVQGLWSVVVNLAKESSGCLPPSRPAERLVLAACREVLGVGSIGAQTWHDLVGADSELMAAREKMKGARENAVAVFEHLTTALGGMRGREPAMAGFLYGYLASEIGRGAFDYAGLIRPLLSSYPTAFLWYGLCSGLKRNPEIYDYSAGLGRRILRDLEQPDSIFRRPRCDIAVAELTMLLDREVPLIDFKTRSSGYIDVEVIPCVTVMLRWPPRSERERQAQLWDLPPTVPDDAVHAEAIRQLVGELDEEVRRVNRVRDRLLAELDMTGGLSRAADKKARKRPRSTPSS